MASRRSHAASHSRTLILSYSINCPWVRGYGETPQPPTITLFLLCKSPHVYLPKKHVLHVFLSKKHDFMSSCQKNMFFMSSCQKNMTSCLLVKKNMASCPPCKYRTNGKKLLQNKNQLQRIKKPFLWCSAEQTAPMLNDSATFTVQQWHYQSVKVALLHDKSGTITV